VKNNIKGKVSIAADHVLVVSDESAQTSIQIT
jgi:hypothetical protein